MTFMRCFDCKKVMWQKPLPSPRDHLVQHKCIDEKVVTRHVGSKAKSCRNDHPKCEQNPRGACVIIISKEDYEKESNDGKYAAWLALSPLEKSASRKPQAQERPAKTKCSTKCKRKVRRTIAIRGRTRKRKFHESSTLGIKTGIRRSSKQKKKAKRRKTKKSISNVPKQTEKQLNGKKKKCRKADEVNNKYAKIEESGNTKVNASQILKIKDPANETKKIEIKESLVRTASSVEREVQSVPIRGKATRWTSRQCPSLNSDHCQKRDPRLFAKKSAKASKPTVLGHESENVRRIGNSESPKPLLIESKDLDESKPVPNNLVASTSSSRSNIKEETSDQQITLSAKVSEGGGFQYQLTLVSSVVSTQLEAKSLNCHMSVHRDSDKDGAKIFVPDKEAEEVLKDWKTRRSEFRAEAEKMKVLNLEVKESRNSITTEKTSPKKNQIQKKRYPQVEIEVSESRTPVLESDKICSCNIRSGSIRNTAKEDQKIKLVDRSLPSGEDKSDELEMRRPIMNGEANPPMKSRVALTQWVATANGGDSVKKYHNKRSFPSLTSPFNRSKRRNLGVSIQASVKIAKPATPEKTLQQCKSSSGPAIKQRSKKNHRSRLLVKWVTNKTEIDDEKIAPKTKKGTTKTGLTCTNGLIPSFESSMCSEEAPDPSTRMSSEQLSAASKPQKRRSKKRRSSLQLTRSKSVSTIDKRWPSVVPPSKIKRHKLSSVRKEQKKSTIQTAGSRATMNTTGSRKVSIVGDKSGFDFPGEEIRSTTNPESNINSISFEQVKGKIKCSSYPPVVSRIHSLSDIKSQSSSLVTVTCPKVKPKAKQAAKSDLKPPIPATERFEMKINNQGEVKTGSSQNPIYLDSDEDNCLNTTSSTDLAVDQICIGRFACRRTPYYYPYVQCYDNHFTLHVWQWERNKDDTEEIKIDVKIVILYSNLTYAAFSRRSNLCFCVFTLSSMPVEILEPIKDEESKLLGKFCHDSDNIQESSIIITSGLSHPIKQIRNLFSKYCHDVLHVLLKKERRKLKPKAYLKAHGLWRRSSSRAFYHEQRALGSSEILVYPKKDRSHGAVTLTMSDVSRLQPGVYLNDNLLDFYLQYLYLEKWDESLRKRVHLFNTFFFKKWIGNKQQKGEVNLDFDLRRYRKVKKWTKTVDIFTKDFLVVPVNYKLHWSLGIVCFPGAVLDDNKTAARRCCILGFDSLARFRRGHFDEIKRYLNMAWSGRIESSVPQLPFTDKSCASIPVQTPSQSNGKDCGVFVLHNCESFFDTRGFADYTKPSPGRNWYPSSDIPQKRIIIHELISKKCGLDLSKELSKTCRANFKRKANE